MKLLGRLAQAVLTVWVAATLSFIGLKLIPGDPVDARFGPLAKISEEQKQQIREELGLELPVWQQYLNTMADFLRGDFGYSYQQSAPVTQVIGEQLPATLQLGTAAVLWMVLFVTLGQLIKRAKAPFAGGRVRGWIIEAAQLIAVSVPVYWFGFTLLIVFAYTLGWFPATPNHGLASLVLPGLALGIPLAGLLGRVVDGELDAAEHTAFALSSRARGMGRGQFAIRHGLRHTLPPAAALSTTLIGGVFGGAVLIEHTFARQGIGKVALAAIVHRDLPIVIALVVFSAVVFAVLGLVTDLVVRWADPRPTQHDSDTASTGGRA